MKKYRNYDHRLKRIIHNSKDPGLFPELEIPKSTAMSWIKDDLSDVVTHESLYLNSEELIKENQTLKNQLEESEASKKLASFTFKLFGLQIQYRRLPTKDSKLLLISAIRGVLSRLPLQKCLDTIGLSYSRYYSWIKREIKCKLDDKSSCPRLNPQKLTSAEVKKITEYVTSKDFAHFSINSLAWYAKRNDEVWASAATWGRIIRDYSLRRPRERIYPPKPTIGIRADAPNKIWHLDLTVIKLLDGTRTYLQAIIDNYSRYILAWKHSTSYGGLQSKNLILQALEKANLPPTSPRPLLMVDSGSENINTDVHSLVKESLIELTVAQIEIDFSNSIIESFFKSIKHRYLYLKSLSEVNKVSKEIDSYIYDHNNVIPHYAHSGGTPAEVFNNLWDTNTIQIITKNTTKAMQNRIKTNQLSYCGLCPT